MWKSYAINPVQIEFSHTKCPKSLCLLREKLTQMQILAIWLWEAIPARQMLVKY